MDFPSDCYMNVNSSYLRVPPQKGNVRASVMNIAIAIFVCFAVNLDASSASFYFLDFVTNAVVTSVLSFVALSFYPSVRQISLGLMRLSMMCLPFSRSSILT